MGYLYPDETTSTLYRVFYGNECFKIYIQNPEISTRKLKNNILGMFDIITYNDIELFIKDEDQPYLLDDDEMLDSLDEYIVLIKNN